MKRTLLDLTQSILSSLNSDEVNSIGDTTESLQVAECIKTTYFNIISRVDLPEHYQLIPLDPSLSVIDPVVMTVPAGISKIQWLKYFNSEVTDTTSAPQGYNYVTILPVKQYLDMVNAFNPSESNVLSFTFTDNINNFPGTYTFYYKNDKQPQYCTIINDFYVIFDGYDVSLDSTLQSSKTMAYGQVVPTFTMEDSFIPNLDESTFPLLLNEAKSLAFFELKQMPHAKAEQSAKRGWSQVQRDKAVINRPTYFDALANFGRNRGFFGGPRTRWLGPNNG